MSHGEDQFNFFISGAGNGMYSKGEMTSGGLEEFETEFYWSRKSRVRGDVRLNGYSKEKALDQGGYLAINIGYVHFNASFYDSNGNALFSRTIHF